MTTHTMKLEVVLPSTQVPVRELLSALANHLAEDAVRYMKRHNVAKSHPAVEDKTDAARAIREVVKQLLERSKARWRHETGYPVEDAT
jgi:hypothetical protein